MRMKQIGNVALTLSITGCLNLAKAAEPTWEVGGGIATSVGTLKDRVGIDYGIRAQVGLNIPFADTNAIFRPGAGLTLLMGRDHTGIQNDAISMQNERGFKPSPDSAIKTDLTHVQLMADVLAPLGSTHVYLVAGLSLNKYAIKTSGAKAGEYSGASVDGGDYTEDGFRTGDANCSGSWPGVKFGFRLGLQYSLDDSFSIDLLLQQTEFGRKQRVQAYAPSLNPAWLEWGVHYKF